MSPQHRRRPLPSNTREVGLWDALRAALAPDTGLGSVETLALIAIWRHTNYDGETWLSLATLARECKVSRRQAIRVVKALESAGAVKVERGGGRARANILRVVPAWVSSQLARVGAESNGTATNDENPTNGDTVSPFTVENGDTVSPFTGKGDTDDRKGDTGDGKGDTDDRKGDTESPVVPLVVPLEAPLVEGGRDGARDPARGPLTSPTPEDVAATIAAATARLGGEWARRGRDIAARYLKNHLGAATEIELQKLTREAGVDRSALGVDFEAMFTAHERPPAAVNAGREKK